MYGDILYIVVVSTAIYVVVYAVTGTGTAQARVPGKEAARGLCGAPRAGPPGRRLRQALGQLPPHPSGFLPQRMARVPLGTALPSRLILPASHCFFWGGSLEVAPWNVCCFSQAGSYEEESIMSCCPCIMCSAALKVIYLTMAENDSFLISLLNPQPGSKSVNSTSQRVLLWLFLCLSGADNLLWLLLGCSVRVLYSLPVEQRIDEVLQQSGEDWALCLTCFACISLRAIKWCFRTAQCKEKGRLPPLSIFPAGNHGILESENRW